MQSSSHLFLVEKENKSIGSQFSCAIWFFFTLCVFYIKNGLFFVGGVGEGRGVGIGSVGAMGLFW